MNRLFLMTSTLMLMSALLVCAGCQQGLETGYVPRPLNSNSTVRRGYYASPFTPEAHAAQMEREQELESRRPKPGY